MKTVFAVMLTFCTLLTASSALARDLPLIEMSSDGCKIKIPLGVQVSDANPRKIEGLFYVNDFGVRKFFSASTLKEMTLVYNHKKDRNDTEGTDVAWLQLADKGGDSKVLTIEYLRNGINGATDSLDMNLTFNVHTARYEIIDPDTSRPVTQAHIIPNKKPIIGMIGIKRLDLF